MPAPQTYRWNHPADWLEDKIDTLNEGRFANTALAGLARTLAGALDGDTIQDLFQNEMEEDGYFRPPAAECDAVPHEEGARETREE